MKLSQYAQHIIAKAGTLNFYASDRARAIDDLIRPFGALQGQQAELKQLKHDLVFDPNLQGKVADLDAKIKNNIDVLERLESVCSGLGFEDNFSLGALRQRKFDIAEEIQLAEAEYSDAIRPFHDAAVVLGDRSLASRHPVAAAAKEARDNKVAGLQTEATTLVEKIKCLENVLKKFQY